MTAATCPAHGGAVPTCESGPLGRLRWVLAEVAAIYRGLQAGKKAR